MTKSTAPIFFRPRAERLRPCGRVQVLDHGLLGVDGQAPQRAVPGCRDQLPLLVRQRRYVEQLGQRLPSLYLDDEHLAAARSESQCERDSDGGLAGAALAGDDVQPRLGREGGRRPCCRASARCWCNQSERMRSAVWATAARPGDITGDTLATLCRARRGLAGAGDVHCNPVGPAGRTRARAALGGPPGRGVRPAARTGSLV